MKKGEDMSKPVYRCLHCKSLKVQSTLPAWFEVNDIDNGPAEFDTGADFEYGYCPDCGESGEFSDVIEDIPLKPAVQVKEAQ